MIVHLTRWTKYESSKNDWHDYTLSWIASTRPTIGQSFNCTITVVCEVISWWIENTDLSNLLKAQIPFMMTVFIILDHIRAECYFLWTMSLESDYLFMLFFVQLIHTVDSAGQLRAIPFKNVGEGGT